MTHDDTTHLLDAILSMNNREELQRFFDGNRVDLAEERANEIHELSL